MTFHQYGHFYTGSLDNYQPENTMQQSAAPRIILTGARAVGGGSTPTVSTPVAFNTPHYYIFAQKGGTLPQYVTKTRAQNYYGKDTFLSKAFKTHQSIGYEVMAGEGQNCFLQRVIPKDANPPAGVALWLELLNENITQYQRNADNKFVVDSQTQSYIPLRDGSNNIIQLPGISGRLLTTPLERVNSDGVLITEAMINSYNAGNLSVNIVPVANRLGQLTARAGIRPNSTMYPIGEWEVAYQGSAGNLLGIKLWPVTSTDEDSPLNEKIVTDNLSFLYRYGVEYKETALSSPQRRETKYSGRYVDFTFKKDTFDQDLRRDLWAGDLLLSEYDTEGEPKFKERFGDFGRIHLYYDDIATVSELILGVESAANGALDNLPENIWLMNFLTGTDTDNSPYLTYRLLSESNDGITLSKYKTIWCTGGSDGTMNLDTFDQLVREQLEGYGELEAKMLDMGRYPVGSYWDTGFKTVTKFRMMDLIGLRKDIISSIGTHVYGTRDLTQDEEISLASALVAHARSITESAEYATGNFRIHLFGQSFNHVNTSYTRERISLIYEIMAKNAAYMGSPTNRWAPSKAYDSGDNKIIRTLKKPNIYYKSTNTKIKDWDNGITSAQFHDMNEMFIPGYPTPYPDQTHPMNNQFTSWLAIGVNKICFKVWTKLVGDGTLSNSKFIELSDKLLRKELDGFGGDRAVFFPRTFITGEDLNNGFSYHCEVAMGVNSAKTVGTFTPVIWRREELLAYLGGNR